MPEGRADAVRGGIAAADDDHVLAVGEDRRLARDVLVAETAVLLGEIGHGVIDAGEVLAGQLRIARLLGAGAQQDGVEFIVQAGERLRHPDIDAVMEGDALGFHLPHAAVDMVLLHLEVGDAVAEQPAGLRLPLEHVHLVADAGELLRAGQAGRSRADHGDALAGLVVGHLRPDPAHLPGLVGDGLLDVLDGDRLVLEVERARLLARRRAGAAGELGEIVGGMEIAGSLLPVLLEDEVVPIRNLVVHGAAARAVAERNAAIHAARRLVAQMALVDRQRELAEVAHAVAGELILLLLAVVFEKPCDLTHPDSFRV